MKTVRQRESIQNIDHSIHFKLSKFFRTLEIVFYGLSMGYRIL